jgi:predicted TIM-barrel fold metal-dependent hydrolase
MTKAPAGVQRVVDCDVHCAVPSLAALYLHLPEQWRDYLQWTNFAQFESSIRLSYPAWSAMLATPGSDTALEDLRRDVLESASIAILHCYAAVEGILHPYLGAAMATAVNRWIAAEWLDRDERLRASAVITPQHPGAAVEEIERIAGDRRFVQLLVPARSSEPYGNQRYWPIWEAAAEHGLVIGLTYGGTSGSPVTTANWMSDFFENYVVAAQAFKTQITSLVTSGVFSRWPDLMVAVAESGWAWVPGLLWRMDAEWKANLEEVPWLQASPSEYVRRHFRFTVQPIDAPPTRAGMERLLEHMVPEAVLMYSSDYPHRYEPALDTLLSCLTPHQRERVLGGTARDLYRLDTHE